MPLVTIASSDVNGDIFTATLQDVAYAVWQAITGGGYLSSLTGYVNQAIIDAETAQPEGAQMEMIISGWSNPITGTDYSGQAADWLNSQWSAGNVTGTEGTPITPWPDYPGQVAWGGGNQVVLRWVKGQIGGPFLILYLVAGLVALAIVLNFIGHYFLTPWQMNVNQQSGTTPKKPSWWQTASLGEKALVVGGVTVVVIFGIWFLSAKSIAEAGAPKQTIILPGSESS